MNRLTPEAREKLTLAFILLFALLHGAIYTILIPPWQHYDEPKHFEKTWLTAHLGRNPIETDNSPKLSRQVVRSMLDNGFFENQPEKPIIGPPSEKIQIPGYSQASEPPGYYFLASLPVRLLSSKSVNFQLYSTRMISILLLLVTVLAGWGITREFVKPGHPLRWMVPASLALTPGFVDLMSAVNNDSAAVAVTSLFLWTAIRLVRRGFSGLNFLLFLLFAGLTFLIKVTAVMILVISPLVILFSFLQKGARKFAWWGMLTGLLFVLAISVRVDDAFGWFRHTSQKEPIRQENSQAPVGRFVFVVKTGESVSPPAYPEVFQQLPMAVGKELAGKQVTFGFWIWADQPQEIKGPELRTQEASFSEWISVDRKPMFYGYQITMPENTKRIWIYLSPGNSKPGSHIFYDGIVLTGGWYTNSSIPIFLTPDGKEGTWDNLSFTNLLQNGSAENRAPRFDAWIDNFVTRLTPDGARPSMLLASLFDRRSTEDLYPTTAIHIFQTFWARFGWGQVPLIWPNVTYQVLWIFTLIGLIGAVICGITNWRTTPWDCVVILGFASAFYFVTTLIRGGAYLAVPGFYYSVARYLYPTIIPWMMALAVGWLEWSRIGVSLFQRVTLNVKMQEEAETHNKQEYLGAPRFLVLYLGFYLILAILSIISVINYYYPV